MSGQNKAGKGYGPQAVPQLRHVSTLRAGGPELPRTLSQGLQGSAVPCGAVQGLQQRRSGYCLESRERTRMDFQGRATRWRAGVVRRRVHQDDSARRQESLLPVRADVVRNRRLRREAGLLWNASRSVRLAPPRQFERSGSSPMWTGCSPVSRQTVAANSRLDRLQSSQAIFCSLIGLEPVPFLYLPCRVRHSGALESGSWS